MYQSEPLKVAHCLLLAFCLSNSYAQTTGDSFQGAIKTKKANLVYVYNDVSDFAKLQENGKVEGILVDLMSEFETYVKTNYGIVITSKFKPVEKSDFNEFLNTVKNGSGGVFGLSNTSITEKRRQSYIFSPAYISNISVLITNDQVQTLTALHLIKEKFEGMTAYSVPSSTYLDRLNEIKSKYFQSMRIKLLSSGQEVIEKVAENNRSFAVVDLLYYLEFFKKGIPVKRHKVGDQSGDKFGIIMPKDSDWWPLIDEFFNSGFMESSKYRIIISNHLGASATRLVDSSKL